MARRTVMMEVTNPGVVVSWWQNCTAACLYQCKLVFKDILVKVVLV